MSEFKRRLKRFLREHGPRAKKVPPPGVEIIPEDLTDEERCARVARAEEMVGKQTYAELTGKMEGETSAEEAAV